MSQFNRERKIIRHLMVDKEIYSLSKVAKITGYTRAYMSLVMSKLDKMPILLSIKNQLKEL